MAYEPFILTELADYEEVRAYAGVNTGADSEDLPNDRIITNVYLFDAETFIEDQLALQAGNGVKSAREIMSSSDEADDRNKVKLKAACVRRIVSQYAVAVTNAVDTSDSTSTLTQSVTRDLGGVGLSWIQMREKANQDCDSALKGVTGWKQWRELP